MKPGVILITGAADRIGAAIATHMAELGWTIALHCHQSRNKADILAHKLSAQYKVRVVVFTADFADTAQRQSLIHDVKKQCGIISALINNAAVFLPKSDTVEKLDEKLWQHHLEINTHAPVHLSQLFARQLPAKSQGCIINLLDQRVWNLSGAFLSYTVSKSALWTLTQTLALALAPRIRVNAIGPGMILPAKNQPVEHFNQRVKNTPLQRSATPLDIAKTCAFILASSALTGQMIALDGGEHLVKKQN